MKAEPILLELEAVKERLAAEASGDTQRFLDQMEAWVVEHPHAGPVVNSPEELQARSRRRGGAADARTGDTVRLRHRQEIVESPWACTWSWPFVARGIVD